jgi:serine/threonine protein kinase
VDVRDTGVTAVTTVTEVQAGKGPPRGSVLLGKYRVESTLGFGGMGLVIKAHNVDLNQDVAIKILREDVQLDEDNIARFVREAKNAVRLKSEHVARIRDVGMFDDGRPYMIMELLEGLDLGKLLLDTGAIEPRRAVDLILQACDAIAEAHALGIVHRDLKPTNLFLARRPDGSDLLKVLDFGISKAMATPEMQLTQTQSMLGTPAYMSPEQMRSARTVDPRSDIWSLGCVLYEAVEGHPPFDATNFAELCVMVATEDPAPLQAAPQLGGVLMRCLAKRAEDRYQNIGELAQDLAPLSSDPSAATRQVLRIMRLLGIAGRDSTPLPQASSRFQTGPALPATPHPTTPAMSAAAMAMDTGSHPKRSSGNGKMIAAFVVLFAVGIGAGLYVTLGSDDHTSHAAATKRDDAAVNEPAATTDAADVVEHDMTLERGSAVDSGGSAVEAGSAATGSATPRVQVQPPKPPVKPPAKPPKKPPAKPPVKPFVKPPGTGTTTIVKPPPKKCDPFDDPHGCKNN